MTKSSTCGASRNNFINRSNLFMSKRSSEIPAQIDPKVVQDYMEIVSQLKSGFLSPPCMLSLLYFQTVHQYGNGTDELSSELESIESGDIAPGLDDHTRYIISQIGYAYLIVGQELHDAYISEFYQLSNNGTHLNGGGESLRQKYIQEGRRLLGNILSDDERRFLFTAYQALCISLSTT